MDRGTWTLQCQSCGQRFEIEVKPGERVIEYAQKEPCPHCHKKPEPLWHHIVAFRNIRTDE